MSVSAVDVSFDQLEQLGRRKRFRERADGAEFFRLGKNLRTAMRRDQHDRYLRLKIEKVGDYLIPRDVSQKQIDHAKLKLLPPRAVDSIETLRDEHHLVAVRLQHQLERVAHRRFIINYQNSEFLICEAIGHLTAHFSKASPPLTNPVVRL